MMKEALGGVALRRSASPTARTLATLVRSRPTWELAVTSAAYVHLKTPQIVMAREDSDLLVIADALKSLSGRAKLPEFVDLAGVVSTLPWKTLIREAPRFAATLHHERPLITSGLFECTLMCMNTFPNGGPEFLKCLWDCHD